MQIRPTHQNSCSAARKTRIAFELARAVLPKFNERQKIKMFAQGGRQVEADLPGGERDLIVNATLFCCAPPRGPDRRKANRNRKGKQKVAELPK